MTEVATTKVISMATLRKVHVLGSRLVVLFGIFAGANACTPVYVIVPASGEDVGKAERAGFVISAAPNTWNDEPSDLSDYLTPIWVQLSNRSRADVRVVYADLSLTDSAGHRYGAVSPYRTDERQSLADESPENTQVSEWYFAPTMQERGELLPVATGDPQFELSRHTTMHGMRGGHSIGGYYGPRGGYYGPRGGYYGPRGHWGAGWGDYGYLGYYSPWPYFYAWPPYYGPYVYYWGPRYYPTEPPEAIRQRGMPEGVLHPGGTVSGFVFFQHVQTSAPRSLDLAWLVHDSQGKAVTVLHVPLSVVAD
jgi:hypothetical protein